MNTVKAKIARWVDEWKLALSGLGLALKSWKFDLVLVIIFVLFGTLMGMLAWSASWAYLWALPDLGAKLSYLSKMFLSIFEPANITMLLISILQAVLIAMIILLAHKKRAGASGNGKARGSASNAGIITGLAILAGGCPTCGTSLLMPLIGAIFSGSSAAVGSAISWTLTAVAIVIALLSFKKVGEEVYVIIVSERRRKNVK